MSRSPFAWEVQVRREVLDDEVARLRDVPYSFWCEIVKAPISKIVKARDDKPYRLEVSAHFAQDGSEDIQVTLSLARRGLLFRRLVRQTFIITRQNTFRT